MLEAFSSIPWWAVLAAAFASFVLGGVWFALLLAKPYARALGKENAPPPKPTPLFLIGPLVCGFVMAATSAVLQALLHIDTANAAAAWGALLGLGYLGATATNVAINPNIPRPLLYALVNVPYFALSSILIQLLLVWLR